MKISLNFIKRTRGVAVALMISTFFLMSGQALAYPDVSQGIGPTLNFGSSLAPTSANLISKRDKLNEFYDQPSFTFNDAVGIQNTGSTNTIQVSKNSVVGALCQKGQLATDGIGKLLSCESGRFAEANGGGVQDSVAERSIFNYAKTMDGRQLITTPSSPAGRVFYSTPLRIQKNMRVELLITTTYSGGVSNGFLVFSPPGWEGVKYSLNLRAGSVLSVRVGHWNAWYAVVDIFVNGRLVKRQYRGNRAPSGTYTGGGLGVFTGVKINKILDLPDLKYNPYRVVLGLAPR